MMSETRLDVGQEKQYLRPVLMDPKSISIGDLSFVCSRQTDFAMSQILM